MAKVKLVHPDGTEFEVEKAEVASHLAGGCACKDPADVPAGAEGGAPPAPAAPPAPPAKPPVKPKPAPKE